MLLLDLWCSLSLDRLSFDQQSLYQSCRAMIDKQLMFSGLICCYMDSGENSSSSCGFRWWTVLSLSISLLSVCFTGRRRRHRHPPRALARKARNFFVLYTSLVEVASSGVARATWRSPATPWPPYRRFHHCRRLLPSPAKLDDLGMSLFKLSTPLASPLFYAPHRPFLASPPQPYPPHADVFSAGGHRRRRR